MLTWVNAPGSRLQALCHTRGTPHAGDVLGVVLAHACDLQDVDGCPVPVLGSMQRGVVVLLAALLAAHVLGVRGVLTCSCRVSWVETHQAVTCSLVHRLCRVARAVVQAVEQVRCHGAT